MPSPILLFCEREKWVKAINLTPHEIVLLPSEGGEVHIPLSGMLARCASQRNVVGRVEIGGVSAPVTCVVLGELSGLPEPKPGTVFIVSLVCAQRAAQDGRTADILVPDDAVRETIRAE